jgi:hypothetical protein
VSASDKAAVEQAVHNRPICVKIENSPEARPQMGITGADVVYETLTEGGISRFNCIYQSSLPTDVGPVRSARNSDITIVPEYQGLLFFSGANDLVLSQVAAAGLPNMVHGNAADLYYRVDYRAAPHNLYLKLQGAYDAAKANGHTVTVDEPPLLMFRDVEKDANATASGTSASGSGSGSGSATDMAKANGTSTATPANHVSIPFSDYYVAQWQWSPEANDGKGAWLRSMDGPSTDEATGEQVLAQNVVVMWANYVPDNAGGSTLEVSIKGQERASLFLDGIRVDGTWKTDGTTPPRFYDSNNNEILLMPGKTWFQVVQLDTEIAVGQ